MSVQKTGDVRRKVASVGNSWIVCNSRSHPGLVYYFNTLTGEAVWNLSSAEIEKAKQKTKDLAGKSGLEPIKCPEPLQPPSINLLKKVQPPEIQYINPFNTSSSLQRIEPFASPSPMLAQQISQISNPAVNFPQNLESLNSSISTLNVQTPPIYNPKVWDVPQTQQVFITAAPNPLGRHVNGSAIGPFNNYNQTVSQTLGFNNFGSTNQDYNATSVANQTFPRHYNYNGPREQHHFNKNKQFNSPQKDLRQRLFVRKRAHSLSKEPGTGIKRKFGNSGDDIVEQNEQTGKSNEVSILEKRSSDIQMHEGPSKMDLTPLKSLAPNNTKSDAWFVVTDFDVLVTEYKFLTALTDSDEQCHLMVPRRVMTELKNYVSSTSDIQARRILRFLPQQIEIGYAFMAEEPLDDEEDSTTEVILTTCVTLAENNYHVILISNDSELLAYKNSAILNIFSVEEVKKMLEKTSNQIVTKKAFMFERLIKITVPNDTKQANNIGSSVEVITPIKQTDQNNKVEPRMENIKDETKKKEVLKRTVDAAIQTDFEHEKSVPSTVNDVEKTSLPTQETNELSNPSVTVTNVINNKKKITLNRSISHQNPLPAAESNVKHFKWRRRRNTTQVNTQTQCNHNTQDKTPEPIDINAFKRDINKQPEKVLNDSPKSALNQTKNSDDSIDSKDSSISIVKHNKKNNVTIEETSTSDIISNTESNLDSETNYSNTFMDQQQVVNKNQLHESPMYEIVGESMEEYLIMNCDEWVSRFMQIMEEVLTQVLQQEPPFSHKKMPPPWTLHEAAQCIAIKFRNHLEIKETANKLSSILFQMSDSKGIIAVPFKPCEYMKMYSYGVHLIDALSREIKSCEDLQIAADSLKKLLEDIKNLNADTGTHDSFNESLMKKPAAETLSHNVSDVEVDGPLEENAGLSDQSEHDLINDPAATPNSLKQNSSPVKFIRNINLKASFLADLRLKQRNNFHKPYSKAKEESPKKQVSIGSKIIEEVTKNSHSTGPPPITEEPANINVKENQKVIRNFSICAEFEEKFKSKKSRFMFDEHDDELDYEEDYDDGEYLTDPHDDGEYLTDPHNDGEYLTDPHNDEYLKDPHNDEYLKDPHNDEYLKDPHNDEYLKNEHNDDNILETNEVSQPAKPDIINQDLNVESKKKFKYVTYMLLKEIRTSVNQVRIFCDQCYEELQKPDLSTVQKREKQKMAETAHIHMERLCKSLERMVDQEKDDYEKFCGILKQAGVNISHIDGSMILEYRNAVSNSIDYAKTFLNAIREIICAFKS